MDCRHTDQAELISFTAEIEADMQATAAALGLTIEIENWMNEAPTPMSKEIVTVLEAACQEANLNFQLMHSG